MSSLRLWIDLAETRSAPKTAATQKPAKRAVPALEVIRAIQPIARRLNVDIELETGGTVGNGAKVVHLTYIERRPDAPPGAGAQVMQALADLADRYRVTIKLTVFANSPKLISYYQDFGFEILQNGNGDLDDEDSEECLMIRYPRQRRGVTENAGQDIAPDLVSSVKASLSPELLQPAFRKKWSADNPTYGHCYVASEALWHMLGGFDSPWRPYSARDRNGVVHWWLRNTTTGAILDPTASQYTSVGEVPPYEHGRARGFLTRKPSKRAREIMRRVRSRMAESTGHKTTSVDSKKLQYALWWLQRWISGSMRDPDWSWPETEAMTVEEAFSIIGQAVGNHRAVAKPLLYRVIFVPKSTAVKIIRSKMLPPNSQYPYQSFSGSREAALDFAEHSARSGIPLLVSTKPDPERIPFGMADLKASRNREVRSAIRALGDWHHQDEVLVHMTKPLPLESAEVVTGRHLHEGTGRGNVITAYHGSLADLSNGLRLPGGAENAIFLTDSREDAEHWGYVHKVQVDVAGFPSVNYARLAGGDPIYDPDIMQRILARARERGDKGVVIRNIVNFEHGDPSTTYAVLDPSVIRSVTREPDTEENAERESTVTEGKGEGGFRRIPFDDLPTEVQTDICENLAERHPYFIETGYTAEDAWANLCGLVHPPEVLVGRARVSDLVHSMARENSNKAVERYAEMLRRNPAFDFDPILIANGHFYDGGHRLAAYARAGRETIPVVECGHIVLASETTWKRWMDGDPDVRFEIDETECRSVWA